ncbi:hypothetical protein HDU67_001543 [Dinochytrium kinnereticum]|nr:hypothetical protein HDU67_001543 [Dinochytrium kinnereticum]
MDPHVVQLLQKFSSGLDYSLALFDRIKSATTYADVVNLSYRYSPYNFNGGNPGTRIDYILVEERRAYAYLYFRFHVAAMESVLRVCASRYPLFRQRLQRDAKDLRVMCFGAGPGSEAYGLNRFLGHEKASFEFIDRSLAWQEYTESVFQGNYHFQDFRDGAAGLSDAIRSAAASASLVILSKVLSEVYRDEGVYEYFRTVLALCSDEAFVLVMDSGRPADKPGDTEIFTDWARTMMPEEEGWLRVASQNDLQIQNAFGAVWDRVCPITSTISEMHPKIKGPISFLLLKRERTIASKLSKPLKDAPEDEKKTEVDSLGYSSLLSEVFN